LLALPRGADLSKLLIISNGEGKMTFWVTFFDDIYAKTLRGEDMTLKELAELVSGTTAPTKAQLPLLKLARFGFTRSAAGSLRHDGNVIASSGCELDYDRGEMPLAEATARLKTVGVAFVAYTTSSHTPTAPRWRVLLPFSRELPPSERARMVNRANGVLGGVLSAESWAVSTAFYFGKADG
jgi:hypothetical protein